jgi:type III secretory pathway component EscV
VRPLPVVVELAPPAFEAVLGDAGGEPARQRIAEELAAVIADCGVAARPQVRFVPASAPQRAQPIRVSVDGQRCLMPPWVLAEAMAYAIGSPTVSLRVSAEDLVGVGAPAQVYEALALVARAAVAAQPEVLVPQDDPLAAVLSLGMSIAGEDSEALRADLSSGTAEGVLERLAAPTFDLLVEPGYLQALTTSRSGGELFTFMREGLFVELGLAIPPMHVRLDPALRPGGFAFRVNAVRTAPRIGLAIDTIYVNDTSSRLDLMEIEAVPSVNPATHQPGSIAPADLKDRLEAAGLTVWDPFGYYILALAAVIRTHAGVLMSPAPIRATIEGLRKAFPAVTAEIGRLYDERVLGPLLRSLLAEQISIRNLRHILQLVVRHAVAPELADGLDLRGFVRAGLADQIAYSASRGTGVVVVYLLDPAFERELGDREERAGAVEPALAEELRNALHAEMQQLPETAQVPCLLTGQGCRATVREVLRVEFPSVRVLDYRDIPGHYNIQPVARISR